MTVGKAGMRTQTTGFQEASAFPGPRATLRWEQGCLVCGTMPTTTAPSVPAKQLHPRPLTPTVTFPVLAEDVFPHLERKSFLPNQEYQHVVPLSEPHTYSEILTNAQLPDHTR